MDQCGICVAAQRNWDPQYLRDPGKLCEGHERLLTSMAKLVPLEWKPGPPTVDMWIPDADASS